MWRGCICFHLPSPAPPPFKYVPPPPPAPPTIKYVPPPPPPGIYSPAPAPPPPKSSASSPAKTTKHASSSSSSKTTQPSSPPKPPKDYGKYGKTAAKILEKGTPAITKFLQKQAAPKVTSKGTLERPNRRTVSMIGSPSPYTYENPPRYTFYLTDERIDALTYWNDVYEAYYEKPPNSCIFNDAPSDSPIFYRRPRIECDGQVVEEFACGQRGYLDAVLNNDKSEASDEDQTKAAGYCIKKGHTVDKQWYGRELQKKLVGWCPAGFETQYLGATRHCWKDCAAGYESHKSDTSRHYYWCDKKCDLQQVGDYCIYKDKSSD